MSVGGGCAERLRTARGGRAALVLGCAPSQTCCSGLWSLRIALAVVRCAATTPPQKMLLGTSREAKISGASCRRPRVQESRPHRAPGAQQADPPSKLINIGTHRRSSGTQTTSELGLGQLDETRQPLGNGKSTKIFEKFDSATCVLRTDGDRKIPVAACLARSRLRHVPSSERAP